MKIEITRQTGRSRLTCRREDGSFTSENLGPDFPIHDLAHYVVETKFDLPDGFYGHIRSGMSIQELSDKAVIKKLGMGSWLAEILTRNLQALTSGACRPEEYLELVEWEIASMGEVDIPAMSLPDILEMKAQLEALAVRWDRLRDGETLTLNFYTQASSKLPTI